jgi:bacterioferritin-associated ferredoxin
VTSPQPRIACYCNNVPTDALKRRIASGELQTLQDIYEQTQAGCGPCGGSCQGQLRQLLEGNPDPTPAHIAPLPREFVRAISLFNRRYYWETHEVLENLWLEEIGARKIFYQGIIQAAAALYHVLNANPKGVLKLGVESLNKLQKTEGNIWKINIQPLISALESYKTQSEEILAQYRSGFDYQLLPKVEISADLAIED